MATGGSSMSSSSSIGNSSLSSSSSSSSLSSPNALTAPLQQANNLYAPNQNGFPNDTDTNNLLLDLSSNGFDFFANQQGGQSNGLLQQATASQQYQHLQQQQQQQQYNANQPFPSQQQQRPAHEMMMDQLRQLSASNQRANEVEDVSNMYDKMLINKQHAGPGAMAHMSQLQQQHNLSVSSLSATPSPSSLSSSSSLNVGMDNNHHGGMMRNQQHTGMNTLGNGPDSMDETESLCDDYPTPSSNFLKVTKTTLDQWSLSIINNSSFFL